jgi:hypothetical protein
LTGAITKPLRRELCEFHEWIGRVIIKLAPPHAFSASIAAVS